jgi:uncharacterized membrane protein
VEIYPFVKALHVIGAAVLLGMGLGIAFFFWMAHRGEDRNARLFAARTTVLADAFFTLPAVILQPLTGAWLVWRGGWNWTDEWLLASYVLYLIAGLCWVPVVFLQLRMRRELERQVRGQTIDAAAYTRMLRTWFLLGWPAFLGLMVVVWLMVAKPAWGAA